jgi:hypothetical protein
MAELRPDHILWGAGALLALAVAAAVRAYLRSRRSQAARTEELKLAGLAPAELPPALAEKLRRLNTGGASLAFRGVWRMARADGELYMLDLWDTGGDNSSLTAQGLVVILSRRLALPRIHVMPRLASLGWLGRLVEPLFSRLVDWGAGRQGLTRVSFPDEPHLESALMVLAGDPDRARAFLGASRALWLPQLPVPLQWEGEGELLCVRAWDWARQGKTVSVSRALENAQALYSILTR